MKYGSVCSGIEAATAAWHSLGWKPAWFAEIESFPSAVLKHHYPEVHNFGDFTTIDESADDIDVFVGGTPCQSFSVAGLRGGLADERGNLALEFLRLADRKRPRWVVWENVPGVLSSVSHDAPDPCPPPSPVGVVSDGTEVETEDEYSSEELHAFNCFLAGLAELGYGFAYRILDAQYFGVPQRRRRVFVVGHLGDWRPAAAVLFERESLCGYTPPRRKAREDVAGSLSARTSGGGGLGTDFEFPGGGYELSPAIASGRGTERTGDSRGQDCVIPILEAGARTGASTDDPRAGIGIGEPGDPMFTLQAGKQHGVFASTGDGYWREGAGTLRAREQESHKHLVASTGETSHCLNAGGMGRIDYETETLVTHSLRGDGFDASEDGTGRGTPLVPVAFDTTQITSKANRSNPQPGDACHPLASSAHPPAIAFNLRGREGGAMPEVDPDGQASMRAASGGSSRSYVAIPETLCENGVRHASAPQTNTGKILRGLREEVGEKAFAQWGLGVFDSLRPAKILQSEVHGDGIRQQASEVRSGLDDGTPSCSQDLPERVMCSLWDKEGVGCSSQRRELAEQLTRELRENLPELSPARAQEARLMLGLRESSEGLGVLRQALPALQEIRQPVTDQSKPALPNYGVRRLTPKEAERLQGFPDGYTLVPVSKKPAADGPRYKALGNSMAVPVMRWIGERIDAVDKILRNEVTQ